eukprot:1736266-Lingulodinium_polyedra.AAC.1
MPASTNYALQNRGHVWTVRPELRGLPDKTTVSNTLPDHALAHTLDYVERASLHSWPRLLREQTTWVLSLIHI